MALAGLMTQLTLDNGLEPVPEPLRRNNVGQPCLMRLKGDQDLESEVSVRSAAILLGTALAAVASLAACGQAQPAAPTTARRPANNCSAQHASPAGTTVTIKNADNGRISCATVGERVLVFLTGTMACKWSPIEAGSAALTPAASGELALRVGVTGASFIAAHPGSARITSARVGCKHRTAAGSMTFHTTVVISRQPQE